MAFTRYATEQGHSYLQNLLRCLTLVSLNKRAMIDMKDP